LRGRRGRRHKQPELRDNLTVMTADHRHALHRAAWLAGALAALGAVFALYTRPAFMVTLIDQIWACF